jgi:hypothetical protein
MPLIPSSAQAVPGLDALSGQDMIEDLAAAQGSIFGDDSNIWPNPRKKVFTQAGPTSASFEGVDFKPRQMTDGAKLQGRINEAVRTVMMDELKISRASIRAEIAKETEALVEVAKKEIVAEAVNAAVAKAMRDFDLQKAVTQALVTVVAARLDKAGMTSPTQLRGDANHEIQRQLTEHVTKFVRDNISVNMRVKDANAGTRRLVNDPT